MEAFDSLKLADEGCSSNNPCLEFSNNGSAYIEVSEKVAPIIPLNVTWFFINDDATNDFSADQFYYCR